MDGGWMAVGMAVGEGEACIDLFAEQTAHSSGGQLTS